MVKGALSPIGGSIKISPEDHDSPPPSLDAVAQKLHFDGTLNVPITAWATERLRDCNQARWPKLDCAISPAAGKKFHLEECLRTLWPVCIIIFDKPMARSSGQRQVCKACQSSRSEKPGSVQTSPGWSSGFGYPKMADMLIHINEKNKIFRTGQTVVDLVRRCPLSRDLAPLTKIGIRTGLLVAGRRGPNFAQWTGHWH